MQRFKVAFIRKYGRPGDSFCIRESWHLCYTRYSQYCYVIFTVFETVIILSELGEQMLENYKKNLTRNDKFFHGMKSSNFNFNCVILFKNKITQLCMQS